jgi:putative transposase
MLAGIAGLAELNDAFSAWAEQVANRRVHSETGETPIARFERSGPHRQVDAERLKEAFRWSVTRKVTRTATVPLEGNSYAVDASLVGRRVELRYDPEDLSELSVYFEGRPAGRAVPFVVARHVHRAVPQAARPEVAPSGVAFLDAVSAAHEEEAGTGKKVDFSELKLFATDAEAR